MVNAMGALVCNLVEFINDILYAVIWLIGEKQVVGEIARQKTHSVRQMVYKVDWIEPEL